MSPPTLHRLLLPRSVYADMIEHALGERPLECCGLLAGAIDADGTGRVARCYRLVNAAASPVEFESEPRSMFAAVRDMRDRGLAELAIYHSHPTTHPVPSRKDLERNYCPDLINLIVSLAAGPPVVRAWWLAESGYREAEWGVEDGTAGTSLSPLSPRGRGVGGEGEPVVSPDGGK
jgi:proteasome lid subunit RPN8/RPN11